MKWKVVVSQEYKYREDLVAFFNNIDAATQFIHYIACTVENVSFKLTCEQEENKDGENQ